MRLFILGNSFSQNATRYLPQLAAEGGHKLHLGRAEVGGCSLQRHWEHVVAAERGAAEGKFYTGGSLEAAGIETDTPKSLRELLVAGTWDVVVFHQASMLSADVESYSPFARQLADYIKNLCLGAEIILHQTWAYRCDAPVFSAISPDRNARDQCEMWRESRAAYHTIAKALGVRLIPTGDAFWKADSDPEWKYRPDSSFDFQHPQYPSLPDQVHSLHAGYYWSAEGQFSLDYKHTSEAGAYLGSLMWYSFLFGASLEESKFVPPEVPADFAAYLRMVATKTLQESAVSLTESP